MNSGLFATQVNAVERFLIDLDLLGDRVAYPLYKKMIAKDFKHLSYLELWEKCYSEKLYDFRLFDDSLLQFRSTSFKPLCVNYSYYECPYFPHISFEDYTKQQLIAEQESDNYDLIRDYELQIPIKKDAVTPIRYDYATSMYTEGLHPASHMHLGHNNQIRVGTKHILRPLSFVLFIIRQFYPIKWQEFTRLKKAEEICRNVSHNLDEVGANYWGNHDMWEMRLV